MNISVYSERVRAAPIHEVAKRMLADAVRLTVRARWVRIVFKT